MIIIANRRIPDVEIKSFISVRRGDAYDPRQLDRGLRALYASGHFTNVKVFVEGLSRGGKTITFQVWECPIITGIAYKGIDAETQKLIAEEWRRQGLEFTPGSEFHQAMLHSAIKAATVLLKGRGYEPTKGTPFVESNSPMEVTITFKRE